jgi:hypothetical protein
MCLIACVVSGNHSLQKEFQNQMPSLIQRTPKNGKVWKSIAFWVFTTEYDNFVLIREDKKHKTSTSDGLNELTFLFDS